MLMDDEYTEWVQDNCSLQLELYRIKKREDETIPMFHFRFNTILDKIHPSFWQRGNLQDYVFAFDPEFRSLLWSLNPTNLKQAFYGALVVHKFLHLQKRFLATENELNYGDIARDEWEDPVEDVSKKKKEGEHES